MKLTLLVILSCFTLCTCATYQAKKFVYAKKFEELSEISDFSLVNETLPELKDGDVLAEALYLSVEPYMPSLGESLLLENMTMISGQIARIIESKNSAYPKDAIVYGTLGWRTHTVFNPDIIQDLFSIPTYVLPSFRDLPVSLGLGILGVPGNTAQFGLLEIIQPKAGEVVVVSGAAGAVGSVVGQIAKIKGAKVIGLAGSDEKCKWITNDLGFDHAINYKNESVNDVLKKYAPQGVDCYFDNVGGEISSTVINQMRAFGRIAVCGSISSYNLQPAQWPKATIIQPTIVFKQLKMEGFLVQRFWSKWFAAIARSKQWIDEGRLKYHETVTDGFENMPQAFIDMLQGKKFGTTVVKVCFNEFVCKK